MRGRQTISPALAISVIALVVAVGGGAFAIASSTRQTKVLIKRISNAQITRRASGLSVKHAGAASSASRLGGLPARHYLTSSSTLAPGDKEVGVFSAAAPNGSKGIATVAFVPKLPEPVSTYRVEELGVGSSSAHCAGPRHAARGYLCIYEAWNFAMAFSGTGDPFSEFTGTVVQPEGVSLYFTSSNDLANVRGNWAYTAPSG
jgi:hypothetical protein